MPPREGDLFPEFPRAAVDVIGYAAAALTTSAFIPQVVKSWRTRSTGDLSASILVVFTASVVLCFARPSSW